MGQIFHRSTNTLARVSIFGAVFIVAGLVGAAGVFMRSPYVTHVGDPPLQPIQFSHKHHVGDAGLDCRYCHNAVENSNNAGMPATQVCMQCHSQLFADSPILEPVRVSFRNDTPIHWTRVYQLADFVYFNHSIHVNKGFGCVTCHGQVDEMPQIAKASSLQMSWCLDCHRNPAQYIRPREEVFNMHWHPPIDQGQFGQQLVEEYGVVSRTDCSTCHR